MGLYRAYVIFLKNEKALLLLLFLHPFSQHPSDEHLWSKLFVPTEEREKIMESISWQSSWPLKLSSLTWFLIQSPPMVAIITMQINITKKNIKLRLLTKQQFKFMRVHFAVNWPSTIRNLASWFKIVTAGPCRLANELSTHWWVQLLIKPLGNLKGAQDTCKQFKWKMKSE